jgi:hypothetical protein
MLEEAGFTRIEVGPPVDSFGDAAGEDAARAYDVFGYTFLAYTP